MDIIAKDINTLQDPDRNKRRLAYERLLKFVSSPSFDLSKEEQLSVLKAVLRGFEDKAERCREVAIQIVSEMLPKQSVDALDWVLPSIVSRIGLEPITEESEECRLLLMRLAILCLDFFPHDIGPRNYLDFYRVLLENCLKDSYPELKKLACLGCQRLCEIEPKRVKPLTVPLAKVVKNMCLQHKHSVVRAEAVRTFSMLLSHGAVELLGDMKDEQDNRTTVYYFHILACDNSESVRAAVVVFLGQMLLDITERLEQHRRLLPHLLIMLTDEHEAVRVAANSVLLRLGKLYMMDNEDNSIHLEKRRITMKDIEWYGDECYPDMDLQSKSSLPLPDLSNRPTLGARYAVAEVVRNVLDKVLADCLALDWTIPFSKHNKRVIALRCLVMLIYFSETNIVQFAQQILAALYKSMKDDNEVVRTESMVCIELMGKFLTPDQYLPFIISQPDAEKLAEKHSDPESQGDLRIERTKTKTVTVVSAGESAIVHHHLPTLFSTAPQTTKSSILVAFKFILCGSKRSLTSAQATQIVRALTNPDLIDLDSPELLLALIEAINALAEVLALRGFISTPADPIPDSIRLDIKQRTLDSMLMYVLLTMKASGDVKVMKASDAAIAQLSMHVTGSATELYSVHFGRLLIRHRLSMPVCAFSDLVLKATNVQYYTAELVSVFVSKLADVNTALRVTAELQYFSVLEGMLRGRNIAFTATQLEELLRSVILHHGTFRPGGPAHLFRKIAMSSLNAILHPFHREKYTPLLCVDNNALAEKITSTWLNAIDSDDADIRLVCINSIEDIVQLPMLDGAAADTWQHLLLRFDDSSDQLRLEVASSIFHALRNHDLMNGALKTEIRQKLATSVKKLLIHMDDHEETKGIKAMVANCLKELCHADKHVVVALVEQSLPKHHTRRYCEDVLQFARGL